MNFGMFSMFTTREGTSQAETFQEWFELVRLAEDTGLDTFWFGETHFRPQRAIMASPLIGASAAATITERIAIGLAVQVLPLSNPLKVAEEAAMVDVMSGGRLNFGIGSGYQRQEFEGIGVHLWEADSAGDGVEHERVTSGFDNRWLVGGYYTVIIA